VTLAAVASAATTKHNCSSLCQLACYLFLALWLAFSFFTLLLFCCTCDGWWWVAGRLGGGIAEATAEHVYALWVSG